MLLKPDEYSTTVREHFRKYGDVLDQVYQIVITKIKRSDHKTFFRELMAQVQDIIYVSMDNMFAVVIIYVQPIYKLLIILFIN